MPDAHVRRAADDLQFFAAVRHAADIELLGVGMLGHAQHFADDDAAQRGTGALDAFDLQARHRQRVRQRRHVIAGVDPFAQPLQTDLSLGQDDAQANCLRKRRSFSKYMRMSLTL